jgi:hypothetical protein
MKLSAVKLFEIGSLSPDIRGKIGPLVAFCNDNFDQVIRALSNKLNLGDNLASVVLEVKLSHGTAKDIQVPNAQLVQGIIPLRVQDAAVACLGTGWRVVDATTIRVTPYYSDPLASNLTTTLGVLFQ